MYNNTDSMDLTLKLDVDFFAISHFIEEFISYKDVFEINLIKGERRTYSSDIITDKSKNISLIQGQEVEDLHKLRVAVREILNVPINKLPDSIYVRKNSHESYNLGIICSYD